MSDREFFKFFSGLIGSLVALAVVLFILAQIVGAKPKEAQSASETKTVAERIKPIGEVRVSSGGGLAGTLIASANAASADKGKATYDTACVACHGTGVLGAPKLGDKAAWKDRIAKGSATLYQRAIQGFQGKKGMMPPKGGNMALTDAQVKAAVDYMVSQAK